MQLLQSKSVPNLFATSFSVPFFVYNKIIIGIEIYVNMDHIEENHNNMKLMK